MTNFSIALLAESDAEELLKLESLATDFPWTLKSFQDSLTSSHRCYCFRNKTQVMAFAIMTLVLDEATLLNIAVHPDFQRRGLAKALLEQSLHLLREDGATMCVLEVRDSNRSAQELYYELGFYEMGHRPNYYPAKKGREDALLMCMPL
ncbi:MAG: ribosomal protein S18-alanine N-acetyltransferase [Pseudomonadales bacterium]